MIAGGGVRKTLLLPGLEEGGTLASAAPSRPILLNLPTGGKEHKGDWDLQEPILGIGAGDRRGSGSPHIAIAGTGEDSVQLLCRGLAGAGDNTPGPAIEV